MDYNSKELMNIDLKAFKRVLLASIEHHTNLKDPKTHPEFKLGFISGLNYVYQFMAPCFETTEIDEASIIEQVLKEEIENLKTKHKLGLDDND